MGTTLFDKLKAQWDNVRPSIEIAETAFFFLRIIILCGGIGWLIFSDISRQTFEATVNLFVFFIVYSALLCLWLFYYPERKRAVYRSFLFFDFLFTSLLVRLTGGFDSPFVNAFYLMTALYSFYYGLVRGAVIASTAAVLYVVTGSLDFYAYHWADIAVRIAFLYLLAVTLGMLSQKLKRDKLEIINLNRDLHRYIEELQKVHGRLVQVEKMSELGRMAADIAHEIRNPLTSIGGFARRLEKKLSQVTSERECVTIMAREKEHAEIIISEVNRLERILKDILTFSREVKYNFVYQSVNGIVKEALQTFIAACKEQAIQVEEEVHPALPEILIDKDAVRLAVNNLMSNAIGAMPEGGTLSVKTFMEEIHYAPYEVIEVSDTGHGIPEDKLSMIFEPFYSSKEIGKGTGLGLSICKKIIDEHNGLINVESELDKGTSFKLLFPYQSKEEGEKIKCWEFHKCGVEKAEGAAGLRCPAYPNYGRICWAVAGTYCGKQVSGAIAQKLGNCQKCEFYQGTAVRKAL
ncbi:MAG TPA: sensor histidine kinase [Nitrospiraceae bacterium]|nr:sensor histidine kinase [Nitrospiraceae bacterium]